MWPRAIASWHRARARRRPLGAPFSPPPRHSVGDPSRFVVDAPRSVIVCPCMCARASPRPRRGRQAYKRIRDAERWPACTIWPTSSGTRGEVNKVQCSVGRTFKWHFSPSAPDEISHSTGALLGAQGESASHKSSAPSLFGPDVERRAAQGTVAREFPQRARQARRWSPSLPKGKIMAPRRASVRFEAVD
jgi:hypothetical protein